MFRMTPAQDETQEETGQPSCKLPRGLAKLGLTRTDLSVLPFLWSGCLVAYFTLIGIMAATQGPAALSLGDKTSLAVLLMAVPSYLIALLRRRWAVAPLWFCYVVWTAPLLANPARFFSREKIVSEFMVFSIPLFAQVARIIRGYST